MSDEEGAYFLTAFSGQIKSLKFPCGDQDDELFFRYDVARGADWELVGGMDGGISQTSSKGSNSDKIVFNMPIDVSFKSISPFGWPQLIISVYGVNSWGVEAARGYGRIHLPTTLGERQSTVPLVMPRSNTMMAEFMSWITGKTPELINPKILADGADNYLLRTHSYGHADIVLNFISKGFKTMGYDNSGIQR